MKFILKHLNGGEQFRFLYTLLDSAFDIEDEERKLKVIQAIMDEVNEDKAFNQDQ